MATLAAIRPSDSRLGARLKVGGTGGRIARKTVAAGAGRRTTSTRRGPVSIRAHASSSSPSITSAPDGSREADVLNALRNVIDPDVGEDLVNCGVVKDLRVSDAGDVTFTLELTTPACPVKEEFDRLSRQFVTALEWAKSCNVNMTQRPATSAAPSGPAGVERIIACPRARAWASPRRP